LRQKKSGRFWFALDKDAVVQLFPIAAFAEGEGRWRSPKKFDWKAIQAGGEGEKVSAKTANRRRPGVRRDPYRVMPQ